MLQEKASPTVQAHLDAIRTGEVTKTNIIGIRKLLNGASRRADHLSTGATTPLGTMAQADEVVSAIYQHRPRIAGELHETGLKVLRNKRYAKRLAAFADSIAAADHFRLVDFEWLGNYHTVPVYALWSKVPPKGDALDGGTYEAFRFRNVPWQSGGDGPELVND